MKPTGKRLALWRKPGARSSRRLLSATNPIKQKLVFLIKNVRRGARGPGWFEVLLPERPNGSTGWVRARDVDVVALRHRLKVNLSRYELEHFYDGKLVNRFTVGIGQDRYPTPTGTFYVWARVPQESASGPYGVYALGISGFSPVLKDWPGGGRAAIHGTANSTDRGSKVSLGCVRVPNSDMQKLIRVPMGTPVIITR